MNSSSQRKHSSSQNQNFHEEGGCAGINEGQQMCEKIGSFNKNLNEDRVLADFIELGNSLNNFKSP